MSTRWRFVALLFALFLLNGLAAGVAGGLFVAVVFDDDDSEPPPMPEQIAPPTVSEVVDDVSNTVVTIRGRGTREEGDTIVESTTVGSGVVLTQDGFIVTNEHVISGAEELVVVLSGGQELVARRVGDDRPFNDLAVLKVQAQDLEPATLGDSDLLAAGQPVVALGHSLANLPLSVSTGVVSGIHRRLFKDDIWMEDLVQTDAAVNQGNSGGALVNMQGELVGILTTVVRNAQNGDVVEGIAFAISSRTIADVAFQIIEQGSVQRPDLGIETQEITIQQAEGERGGAVVVTVDGNGPASQAGIIAGDVILSINDDDVSEEQPFLNLLKALRPGTVATLEVLRNAQVQVIEVEVVERTPRL
ncbi:MAG TPA: trypsin-like peptidase domain-containing protein [Dehalococcoidia bacterium]|nr:trypsin-like peptidase domain-containing protein [Dehalococcoidia bacterium]